MQRTQIREIRAKVREAPRTIHLAADRRLAQGKSVGDSGRSSHRVHHCAEVDLIDHSDPPEGSRRPLDVPVCHVRAAAKGTVDKCVGHLRASDRELVPGGAVQPHRLVEESFRFVGGDRAVVEARHDLLDPRSQLDSTISVGAASAGDGFEHLDRVVEPA